jgi:cytoskeletal protein CcmA (bactofilin family)
MNTHPLNPVRSEKGVALIIVLLLLAVMAGLTTGLTLNGTTEIAMASNELYYSGARAAAEAGLNRAIEQITADTTTDLLAAGAVPVIGNGPFGLGDLYSYSLEILDDDDPSLYTTALTAAQLTQMGEDGDPAVNGNERLILRATGIGPNGTTIRISRVLQTVATENITTTTTTVLSNPAIVVNGSLDITGSSLVNGTQGNVHANGDITGGGSATVSGNLTATGTVPDRIIVGGLKAGNQPSITVPEIRASDYRGLADWILKSNGTITNAAGTVCGGMALACPTGWSYSAATNKWSSSGAMPSSATYYVQGAVSMHGTGKSRLTAISVIAEGNITIDGNGQFTPENSAKIQFVTNGDFDFSGNADADDPTNLDGQIMVREQIKIQGNSEFQGRIMVQDADSATNVYDAVTNPNGRRGASSFATNNMTGNTHVTYNGSLGDIVSKVMTTTTGPTTYTNNVSGWIES